MKQRLLLTGGSGFLGRAIHRILKNQGGYAVKAPGREIFDLTRLDQAIHACRKANVVVHAAGLVLSRVEQQKRPVEVLFQNLAATLNIAEAARLSGVKKLIFVSSITAYGDLVPSPFKEKDLWLSKPQEANFPYGISKRVMDAVATAYRAEYGMQISTLIFPNLYGPADKFSFNPPPLVPNAILQIYKAQRSGQKTFFAGNNGHQYIDLLYVDDAAEAVKLILQMRKIPVLMNVGTGRSVQIAKVFSLVAKFLGYKGKIVWEKLPGKAKDLCLDVSEMKKQLGWSPKISLEQGISSSVKWFLSQH